MDMFEIGQLLRTSRKAQHGASQASVGAPLGMSRATISGIENGTIPEIGIRKVMALCDALGFELVIRFDELPTASAMCSAIATIARLPEPCLSPCR